MQLAVQLASEAVFVAGRLAGGAGVVVVARRIGGGGGSASFIGGELAAGRRVAEVAGGGGGGAASRVIETLPRFDGGRASRVSFVDEDGGGSMPGLR